MRLGRRRDVSRSTWRGRWRAARARRGAARSRGWRAPPPAARPRPVSSHPLAAGSSSM